MGDRLKELKERSQMRKKLLAQALGVDSTDSLKTVLNTGERKTETVKDKVKISSEVEEPVTRDVPQTPVTVDENKEEEEEERLKKDDYDEDELYRDSSTFLKGTQSANPHNDYCQNFVDTGERPQNFIRDVGLANRFEEYPKLRELIRLKDELIAKTNTPPMYLQCDLEDYDLRNLKCKFDVILVEPPLEEYQRTQGAVYDRFWSWDEIERLDISAVAAQRSFLWIWCGNAEGLDRGRQCLKRWGFRRCEDICWIKTNIKNPSHKKNLEPNAVFQRTKEHCLMGIKGTVKRSTDGDFIHANVDIDLIIEEEPEYGTKDKPIEIFHMIEHFCLGKRRLHLFGRDSTIRPGWLTLGSELTSSNFDPDVYLNMFDSEISTLTGCSEEIERLRPKSPPHTNKGERGRGARGGFNSRGTTRGRGDSTRGIRGTRSRGRGPPRGRGFPPSHRGAGYEPR